MFLLFFLTTFGPHHFWPRPTLGSPFLIKPFCTQNLCEPSLTPKKKPWPMGQFVAHVLIFGPWTSVRKTPSLPKIPRCVVFCVVLCCVVLWCGVVCPPSPDSPSAGPPLPTPPQPLCRDPPPDIPKFRSFFPLPQFSYILPSLGGLLVEFWWC